MARGRNKQDRNWNSVGHRNITLTYHAFHRRRIEKDQTGLGGVKGQDRKQKQEEVRRRRIARRASWDGRTEWAANEKSRKRRLDDGLSDR